MAAFGSIVYRFGCSQGTDGFRLRGHRGLIIKIIIGFLEACLFYLVLMLAHVRVLIAGLALLHHILRLM
jgi:hypothetical protein